MDLYFKKPSPKARMAMCNAAKHVTRKNRDEHIKAAESEITNVTSHKYAKVVNSGNSAILAIMSTLKGRILIPDQGGWSGFKKIAQFLGMETVEIPTDKGLINPDVLSNLIQINNPEAVFLTSFAGYTAEQPLKDIFKICDDMDVLLVEDASGAVGDESGLLANETHSHVIVASTGSPKIVNVGNGGFISTDKEQILNSAQNILKTLRADPITCAGISEEIKFAPLHLSTTIRACSYLKKNLDNIFHPNKRGINVIIPSENTNKTVSQLKMRLKVHGGGMITKCPSYDRIMDKAVALEIKNLDTRCLTIKNMNMILEIIKECF